MTEPARSTDQQPEATERTRKNPRSGNLAGHIGNALLVLVVLLVVALGVWLQAPEPRDCNLAQQDGRLSCVGNAPLTQGQRAVLGSTVDLNTATPSDLARLPGIGAKRAAAIAQHRQEKGGFCSLADLQEVRGIGPKTVARLSSRLEIGSVPERCDVP